MEMKSFIKWAGSKKALLKEILPRLPMNLNGHKYIEPFVGSGAVFLRYHPSDAIINDINPELIAAYKMIRDKPEELIAEVDSYPVNSEFFYEMRQVSYDWTSEKVEDLIKIAARFIYLNKTAFNGLYRLNSKGGFNVPYNKLIDMKNHPFDVINHQNTIVLSHFFNRANLDIYNYDFEEVIHLGVSRGDMVYLDPPYDNTYIGYKKQLFNEEDQKKLYECCEYIDSIGAKFLYSNNDTELIRSLFSKYKINEVYTKRMINPDVSKRGKAKELLIQNY